MHSIITMKKKKHPMSPEMRHRICKRLRKLRQESATKMQTIEAMTGIAQGTISKIENGHYEPLSIGMLEDLARFYKVDVDYFFTTKDPFPLPIIASQ